MAVFKVPLVERGAAEHIGARLARQIEASHGTVAQVVAGEALPVSVAGDTVLQEEGAGVGCIAAGEGHHRDNGIHLAAEPAGGIGEAVGEREVLAEQLLAAGVAPPGGAVEQQRIGELFEEAVGTGVEAGLKGAGAGKRGGGGEAP